MPLQLRCIQLVGLKFLPDTVIKTAEDEQTEHELVCMNGNAF